MYVCICNAITDKQIRQAAEAGVQDLWALQKDLGVATSCGACKETAADILSEYRKLKSANAESAQPRIYRPAVA